MLLLLFRTPDSSHWKNFNYPTFDEFWEDRDCKTYHNLCFLVLRTLMAKNTASARKLLNKSISFKIHMYIKNYTTHIVSDEENSFILLMMSQYVGHPYHQELRYVYKKCWKISSILLNKLILWEHTLCPLIIPLFVIWPSKSHVPGSDHLPWARCVAHWSLYFFGTRDNKYIVQWNQFAFFASITGESKHMQHFHEFDTYAMYSENATKNNLHCTSIKQ